MSRRYTKVEELVEVVRVRHEQGETYGEIASSYGLRKKQLKQPRELIRQYFVSASIWLRQEKVQAVVKLQLPRHRWSCSVRYQQ